MSTKRGETLRVLLLYCVRAMTVNDYMRLISCLTGAADKNNVGNSPLGLALARSLQE